MPSIFNVKHRDAPKGTVYVGRGTPYGNPYRIGVDGTRSQVILKFRGYAIKKLEREPNWLSEIQGKDLVCHCVPEDCHAHVLMELSKRSY